MTNNTPDCCPNGNIGAHEKIHATQFISIIVILMGLVFLAVNNFSFLKLFSTYLVYLSISALIVTLALIYFSTQKGNITSMTGMMVGMTIGMIAGFLLGGAFALLNGYFAGTIIGMTLGCLFGAYAGKRTGVMGVMEGLMAGAMGGSMGAMLIVMMPLDKVPYFMPFFIGINFIILVGLCYLICRYCGDCEKRKHNFFKTLLICAVILTAFIALAVILPKNLAIL